MRTKKYPNKHLADVHIETEKELVIPLLYK